MEKVIIEDGLALTDNVGPGQYTLVLIDVLKKLGYEVIIPKKILLSKIKNKNLRRVLYLIWLNTLFFLKLFFIKKGTPVIYTNYSVPFIKVKKTVTIPVIHDLCSYLFPQTMTKIQNFYSVAATNNAVKNSDKIITVSNTVKDEIIKEFHCNKNDVVVVHCSNTLNLNPLEGSKESELLDKFNLKPNKYIIGVSTFNKRKNIIELIEGFNLISKNNHEIKLVLAGGNGNDERINQIKSKNGNIVFTGYLKNEELASIYRNALVFVSPSLYEGFGIPIIDAQKFGVPVICSDIPVYQEITGKSAEFFNPERNDIAEQIMKLISNEALRNELIKKGGENYLRFNENTIALQLKNVLKKEELYEN